ncbi:unnamed protein product [Chrysoparadoxa australica]
MLPVVGAALSKRPRQPSPDDQRAGLCATGMGFVSQLEAPAAVLGAAAAALLVLVLLKLRAAKAALRKVTIKAGSLREARAGVEGESVTEAYPEVPREWALVDIMASMKQEHFKNKTQLATMPEYLKTLQFPPDTTNAQVWSTILGEMGPKWAVPLALFLPDAKAAFKTQEMLADNPTLRQLLDVISSDVISPVMLAATLSVQSNISHGIRKIKQASLKLRQAEKVEARQQANAEKEWSPLQSMLDSKTASYGGRALPDLPNPFVITTHLEQTIAALEISDLDSYKEGEGGMVAPNAVPGLYCTYMGVKGKSTRHQEACDVIFSTLFNLLAGNQIPAKEREEAGAASSELFRVQILQQDPRMFVTPEALIKGLRDTGHTVRAEFHSYITSFGFGLSFWEDDLKSFVQIPVAYPYKTGIRDPDGESATDQIGSLLPHASAKIFLSGPAIPGVLDLEFYQGAESFCGWCPGSGPSLPWVNDREANTFNVLNPRELGEMEVDEVARFASLISVCANLTAHEGKFPMGGYGSVGICLDSTAVLMSAVMGECRVFPLLLGGAFKEHLIDKCREMMEVPLTNARYPRSDWTRLLRAYIEIPNDIIVDHR